MDRSIIRARGGLPLFAWTFADAREWIGEHRRGVTIGLVALVGVLALVAVILAVGLANSLPTTGAAPSETAEPTEAPSASPAASAEPSEETSPTSEPSATERPTPPASADSALAEGWVEVGSFGEDGTIHAVHDVVQAPFGLLAAGVRIEDRLLPVFGPLPQQGRVWLSSDGRSWEDVTPEGGTFADSSVYDLAVLDDGTVVAFARVNALEEGVVNDAYAAWETADGRTWTGVEDLSLGSGPVVTLVQGGAGYLAWRHAPGGPELWHSTDGRSFALTRTLPAERAVSSVGAGPEGFVVVTQSIEGSASPTVHASGDGIEWFEAPSPASALAAVAPIGSDWVATAASFSEDAHDGATWTSPNGLDWSSAGTIPRRTEPLDESTECTEFPVRVISSGRYVVDSSQWSYPCGEGQVQRFGSAHITADGSTWTRLPFTAGGPVPDVGSTRGTTVNAALDLADGTLLVGESDYRATFWYRPSG